MLRLIQEEELERKVELLKNIPLFSVLDSEGIGRLASSCDTLMFNPGQIVFRQGDIGREAYLILSGEAEIITEGPGGEITVATLGKNQIVGEIATLIDVPRTATVVAMQELATLVISKEMFFYLLERFPSVGLEIMRELARRISHTTATVRELGSGAKPARSED